MYSPHSIYDSSGEGQHWREVAKQSHHLNWQSLMQTHWEGHRKTKEIDQHIKKRTKRRTSGSDAIIKQVRSAPIYHTNHLQERNVAWIGREWLLGFLLVRRR